jgi:NAD(P)-dependent dehydrogenase (short-subunit alcohol dehydrogenase family)
MNTANPATILSGRFPAKRAFITGGAGGLGRAMAAELARDGWTLGLLDLRAPSLAEARERLLAAGAVAVHAYAGDVADESVVGPAVADFAGRCSGLDLIVNNAGVAVAGALEETPAEDWRWIVGINLLGVAWGCRAALPHLRAQGAGLILNVASSAGFASAPLMSAYNATKAGVISLSETLAAELQESGVQVSVAMPGFFRTGLLDTLRAPAEADALARRIMERSGHDAAEAARALLAAAAAGDLYVIWPPEYRWAWRVKRLLPRWFVRRLAPRVEQRLGGGHPPRG